jgi:hypothetical protein
MPFCCVVGGDWVVMFGGFGIGVVGIIVLDVVHPLLMIVMSPFMGSHVLVFWVFSMNGRFDLLAFFELVDYEGFGLEGVWVLGGGGCQAEEVAVWEMDLLNWLGEEFDIELGGEIPCVSGCRCCGQSQLQRSTASA